MNYNGRSTTPQHEQAVRLRGLVADIVQCCQERTLFESDRFGLPPAELKCLLLFKEERYLTAKTLAARLEVGKSRVTRLVDGLIRKDLIESSRDPKDGRYKLLSLTRTGRERMDLIEAFLVEAHGRVLEQMEPQQRTSVLACLELLRSSMLTVEAELGMDS